MSLELFYSDPKVVLSSTPSDPLKLCISGGDDLIIVNGDDMMAMIEYWITNTNLGKDDRRLAFLERLKKYSLVTGWGDHDKRIVIPEEKT